MENGNSDSISSTQLVEDPNDRQHRLNEEANGQGAPPQISSSSAGGPAWFDMLMTGMMGQEEHLLQQYADAQIPPLPDAYNDDCPICKGPFEDQPTAVTCCRHKFCAECLDNWYTHSQEPICPICRAEQPPSSSYDGQFSFEEENDYDSSEFSQDYLDD